MGQYFSIEEIENQGKKNYEYYTGERNFKVSRGLYPQFTKGYIWGRNEDKTYWFNLGWDEETQTYLPLEKAF